MLTRKKILNLRVTIALSALLLLFLAEPLLAKKTRNSKPKSNSAISKKQNAKKESNPPAKPKPKAGRKVFTKTARPAGSAGAPRKSASSHNSRQSNQRRKGFNQGIRSSVKTSSRRSVRRNRPVISAPKRRRTTANLIRAKRSGNTTKREQATIKPVEKIRMTSPIKKQKINFKSRTNGTSTRFTTKNKSSRNRPERRAVTRQLRTGTFVSSGKKRGNFSTDFSVIKDRKNSRAHRQRKLRNTATTRIALNNTQSSVLVKRSAHGSGHHRARQNGTVIYEDRHRRARHNRYEHVYRDSNYHLRHQIIRPGYRFQVHYSWGSHFVFRYVYPYYHRKYIFVSLSGYWPTEYTYPRYYWYPSHFYDWYGYYPIARQVENDTYNYYTYNYYGDGDTSTSRYSQKTDGISFVDHTTFADIRRRLADQQEPEVETIADLYFDEAVKAFEGGDYALAADKFAQAAELAPEDMILPFAYAQALFANAGYTHAVRVIRSALEKNSSEKLGVFYPRGLYPDEEILRKQIDALAEQVEFYPFNSDLQLLLGYQLLGIGEVETSIEPLAKASRDNENTAAAAVLLELAARSMADNEVDE